MPRLSRIFGRRRSGKGADSVSGETEVEGPEIAAEAAAAEEAARSRLYEPGPPGPGEGAPGADGAIVGGETAEWSPPEAVGGGGALEPEADPDVDAPAGAERRGSESAEEPELPPKRAPAGAGPIGGKDDAPAGTAERGPAERLAERERELEREREEKVRVIEDSERRLAAIEQLAAEAEERVAAAERRLDEEAERARAEEAAASSEREQALLRELEAERERSAEALRRAEEAFAARREELESELAAMRKVLERAEAELREAKRATLPTEEGVRYREQRFRAAAERIGAVAGGRGRSAPTTRGATAGAGDRRRGQAGGPVRLAEADIDGLRGLGMSVEQAKRVLRHRDERGLESVEELEQVPGLPASLLERVRGQLVD